MQKFIEISDKKEFVIYKGEKPDEDLSKLSEGRIWEILKDKIFDSSLTIVFISPCMNEIGKSEKNQWIPREIVYSLREQSRNKQNSLSNSLLYVVLPDTNNRYDYFKNHYNGFMPFKIIQANLDNGYAAVAYWDDFIKDMKRYIDLANSNRDNHTPIKQISGETW